MPARTGAEYIKGLRDQEREVWLRGERVKDVTTHPALCNGMRSIAELYDMQHDPALTDAMTYLSPSTGERVGLSFITPKTPDDLVRRRVMMSHWARTSFGMMGRTPDFLNVSIMAMAAAGEVGERGDVGDAPAPEVDLAGLRAEAREVLGSGAHGHGLDLLVG